MKKLIPVSALAGFSIAMLIGSSAWYAELHSIPATSGFVALLRWLVWLWPTVILNGPDGLGVACNFGACLTLLLLSSIANAALYAGLAIAGRFSWNKLFAKRISRVES